MKKLMIFISLLAFVAIAQAQTITCNSAGSCTSTILNYTPKAANYVSYAGVAQDTAAHTLALKYKVFNLTKADAQLNWVMTSTISRESGNVAGHRIQVDRSYDGVNWTQLNALVLSDVASTVTSWASGDTVSKTNAPFLRFSLDSDGTGVTKIGTLAVKYYPKY